MDKDGKLDIVASSFDGKIKWAKNEGKGKFSKPVVLKAGKKKPAAKDLNNSSNVPMYPFACDWDADGDMDLVIGGFDGKVYLLTNEKGGMNGFAAKSQALKAGDKAIQLEGHACPAVVDWDKDGKLDLVCASEVGEVFFYKNTGTKDKPIFAKGKVILERVDEGDAKKHKIPNDNFTLDVKDYNADGKLDLIVGGLYYDGEARKEGVWVYLAK